MSKKRIVRLTESDLHKIIKEAAVRLIREEGYEGEQLLNDEEEEDYDPWLSGDASWINGKYNLDGYDVEINTGLSYVSVQVKGAGEEGEYFLQGDEADDLIVDICKYYNTHDCNQAQAVDFIIRHTF